MRTGMACIPYLEVSTIQHSGDLHLRDHQKKCTICINCLVGPCCPYCFCLCTAGGGGCWWEDALKRQTSKGIPRLQTWLQSLDRQLPVCAMGHCTEVDVQTDRTVPMMWIFGRAPEGFLLLLLLSVLVC